MQHPNKVANVLEVDHHQKILFKFQLRDVSSGDWMEAHQTFVRLTNQQSRQEIIFTATADTALVYKFNLVSRLRLVVYGLHVFPPHS